jgi:hypothetical protein
MNRGRLPGTSDRSPQTLAKLRTRRGLLGGGTLLSGLVAVLMLAAPLTSGHGVVTFSAPFTGFSTTQSNYTATSGCGVLHQPSAPTWNGANGTLNFGASAAAGHCTLGFAEAYTSVSMVSPKFSAPFVGFGYLTIGLTSSFAARASAVLPTGNASNGSYSYADSDVSLVVGTLIYDVTHHNFSLITYTTTTIVGQQLTSTGTFSLSMSAVSQTVYAYGTFTGGHLYQLYVDISAYVYADTYGTGTSAAASLNLSGANALVLGSIVVS